MDNFETALIIACLMILAYIAGWIVSGYQYHKRQKQVKETVKNPADYTNITYDSTGNIKQLSKELRQLRKGGR
jgi:uncharacterized ion transporter superfamily protein YfcC